MASATELEKLVVKLLGDASDYTKTLDKAEKDTQAAVRAIEKATQLAMRAQNDAMQEAAAVTAAVATPTEVYKQKIKSLDRMLKEGLITQQTYNRAFEEAEKGLPKVAAAQQKMNDQLARANQLTAAVSTADEKYKQRIGEVNTLLSKNYITQQTANRALQEAKRDFEATLPPAKNYKAQLQAINATATSVAGNLRAVSSALTGVGTKMSIGVTAPIMAGAGFSAHEFGRLQQGIAGLNASVKPTAEQLAIVRKEAMKLSKELHMDPTLVVSSFTELLKAGMPLEKVLAGAGRAAAQFAKVGELDVMTAAVVMADAQKVFGEEASKTADILSAAADASSTSIKGVAEAFGQASAVAHLADQTLLDTSASIAILANAGIKGSDAGTSLKSMFIMLAAPAKHGTDVIEKYGLVIRDASGTIRPMAELAQELQEKLGGLNKEARDNALKHLFGTDALRAGSIFMEQGKSGFDEMVKSMAEANSVAQKYNIIMDTMFGKMEKFWSSVRRLAITLGGPLAGGFSTVIDYISNLIDQTTEWLDKNPEMMQVIGIVAGIAAAIGPLLIGAGALVGVFASVTAAVAFFVTVGWEIVLMAAAVTAGILIFSAEMIALGAVIAGLIYWIVGPESLSNAFQSAMKFAKEFVMNTIGFFYNFQANVQILTTWFGKRWHQVFSDVGNIAMTVWFNMWKNFGVALRVMFRLFVAFQGWMTGMLQRVFTKEFVNFAITGVIKVAKIFGNFANQAWLHLKSIFSGKKVGFGDFIKQMGKDFEAGAENMNFLETAGDILKEEAKNLVNPLEGFVSSIEEGPALVLDIGKKTAEAYNEGLSEVNPEGPGAPAGTNQVETAIAQIEKMGKEETKAAKEVAKMSEELKKQSETYGMNARQKKIWEMQQKGATEAQLSEARAIDEKLTGLEKEKKMVESAARVMAKQKAEAGKHMSPAEQFAKEQEELTSMLDKKLISIEAYNSEIADAKSKMEKDVKQMNKDAVVDFKVTGIDAVEAGSAEAMARLAQFRALRSQDAVIPGGVGLEPKVIGGKVKAFAEGDMKVVAAMEAPKATREEKLIDLMSDAVDEIKIGNDLMREDTSPVIEFETVGLGG